MSNPTSGTTRYTLDLPTALHRRLRLRAFREERPASELCRELLETYLHDDACQDASRLQAAFQAGVDAERKRIAEVLRAPHSRNGLPTRPPVPSP